MAYDYSLKKQCTFDNSTLENYAKRIAKDAKRLNGTYKITYKDGPMAVTVKVKAQKTTENVSVLGDKTFEIPRVGGCCINSPHTAGLSGRLDGTMETLVKRMSIKYENTPEVVTKTLEQFMQIFNQQQGEITLTTFFHRNEAKEVLDAAGNEISLDRISNWVGQDL